MHGAGAPPPNQAAGQGLQAAAGHAPADLAAMALAVQGLAHTVKVGFARVNKRVRTLENFTKEGFARVNKRVRTLENFTKEGFARVNKRVRTLENFTKEGFARANKRVGTLNKRMNQGFVALHARMDANHARAHPRATAAEMLCAVPIATRSSAKRATSSAGASDKYEVCGTGVAISEWHVLVPRHVVVDEAARTTLDVKVKSGGTWFNASMV